MIVGTSVGFRKILEGILKPQMKLSIAQVENRGIINYSFDENIQNF
jgi:hypothetical protein